MVVPKSFLVKVRVDMQILYNQVFLTPIETHYYDWQAVYDDTQTDYLYTRVAIGVTAIVNGQVDIDLDASNRVSVSYDWDGTPTDSGAPPLRGSSPPIVPVNATLIPVGAGLAVGASLSALRGIRITSVRPFRTQEVIRHRLDTPRAQLMVFSNTFGQVSLASPSLEPIRLPGVTIPLVGGPVGFRRPCDCKNGPTPKTFNVSQVMSGDNTFVVDWECETYVNEAAENNVNPSGGLLSNRFHQTHSVNDDGFTTITTEGVAIFRTDFVFATRTNPDSQRAVLFMPIGQGFVRTIDYVRGRPDVTGIEYGYTDTQVAVNFVAGPYVKAAKIAAVHRQAVTSNADILTGALSTYDRAQSTLLNGKWLKEDKPKPESKFDIKKLSKAAKTPMRFPSTPPT